MTLTYQVAQSPKMQTESLDKLDDRIWLAGTNERYSDW